MIREKLLSIYRSLPLIFFYTALMLTCKVTVEAQTCETFENANSPISGSGTFGYLGRPFSAPASTSFRITIGYISLNCNVSWIAFSTGGGGSIYQPWGFTDPAQATDYYYTTVVDSETYSYDGVLYGSAGYGIGFEALPSPKNLGVPPPNCPNACGGNPINAATGNKLQIETDYLGAPNTHLELRRMYNSLGTRGPSNFGQLWRGTYDRSVYNNPGSLVAQVIRADGRIDSFWLKNGRWVSDPDVTSTLTQLQTGGMPTFWQVVTADDSIEIYSLSGQLLSITTRAGLTTSLSYNSNSQLTTVAGPFGHTLSFSYNSSGSVSQIVAPDGGIYAYAYDSKNNLISVSYPDSTVRRYVYENTSFPNNLTGIIDELGNRFATYSYDASGRAVSTEHAGGAELTTVSYVNANLSVTPTQATVSDARGNAHSYTFQTQFGVVKPTALTGTPVQSSGGKAFTYDSNGFISSRTDWNGNITAYTHDSRGDETSRVEAFGTPLARTITTTWLLTFHLPTKIVEPNRTTTFSYDANGNLLTRMVTAAAASRTWTYTYNGSGQIITATLRRTDLSDTTKYSYDSKGDLAAITDPLGHVTRITSYDANGRPLLITDPNGLVTTLSYDPRGRLTSRTVGTETTSYTYDAAGNLIKVTQPDDSFLIYSYDQAHRLTGETDALGNSVVYTLDATDNRIKEKAFDPDKNLKRTRSYAYDNVNRLTQEVGAQSQTTSYIYDPQGNLTKITDPLNHRTSYAYDALNRLAIALDPDNGSTAYGYDANDDLTSVTDPRGLNTVYMYDGIGDQKSIASPDTGKTARTFDPAGNVSVSTDARGDRTIFAHDALNRKTKATFADGKTIVWSYDQGVNGIGHLTAMTDSTGTTAWSYDQHGRVIFKTQQTGSVTLTTGYTYDSGGRRASITYPSGKQITYTYDDAGQVNALRLNGQPLVAAATYFPFGIATGWTQSNGTAYSRTIDQDARITGIGFGGTALGLIYDGANRITAITETGLPNRSVTYDALNRVTNFSEGNSSTGYTYDVDGNRLSSTVAAGTTNYTYAANSNRLAALSGLTSEANSYDADGDLLSDGTRVYSYDARGRLVQATAAAITTQYGINGLGQRVSKSSASEPSGANEFVYDEAGHLIGEYDISGSVIEEMVWLGDTPVAVLTKALSIYAVSPDWLNAPHVITDGNSTTVWTWDHLAFGDNAPNQNPSRLGTFVYNLRFPGQYADAETGLNYNLARDYNSVIGRYAESDPIGLDGGLNSYVYAAGKPISIADPTGLDWNIVQYASISISNLFGHTGISGVAPNITQPTVGFYPTQLPLGDVPGVLKLDTDFPTGEMFTLQTTPLQDLLIFNYLQTLATSNKDYNVRFNNCAQTAAAALNAAGIPAPQTSDLTPQGLMDWARQYQPFTPVPATIPTYTPVPQRSIP